LIRARLMRAVLINPQRKGEERFGFEFILLKYTPTFRDRIITFKQLVEHLFLPMDYFVMGNSQPK
jgi:hypothetical protein